MNTDKSTIESSNLKDEIQKNDQLSHYYKIKAMAREGLAMEWILRCAIIPDGTFNRQNGHYLKPFFVDEGFSDGFNKTVKSFK